MSASIIGSVLPWIILAVIVIAVIFWILQVLYFRSTKEMAFVRTGLFGERVVIDGGAFVWPMVHNVTPVNMNTLPLAVRRVNEDAIITKDRMRVDMEADFYVRVAKSRDAVSRAASTLGARTMKQDSLLDLLSGKFVSSLREVASGMSMSEIHEQRSTFVSRIKDAVLDALAENGLELESVAITEFDQTGLEYFNPSNRFDAEGLTQLISEIEERRKTRNDIEQETSVAIRARDLEAEKRSLEISLESENSRLSKEREIERLRAEQQMIIARERSERAAETEAAKLAATQATETKRIAQEQAVSAARIASEKTIRRQEIDRMREIESAEIEQQKALEMERIGQEEALSIARIAHEAKVRAEQITRDEDTRKREIARVRAEEAERIAKEQETAQERIASEQAVEEAEIAKALELERQRIVTNKEREVLRVAQQEALKAAEIARDKALQRLEIERTQALREAEIASREEVERARIASERGLDEARITQERDRRRQEIDRDQSLETAELDKVIAIATKSLDEVAARIEAEAARAKLAEAEEAVLSARATEEASRRRSVELTLAEKDAEAAKLRAAGHEVEARVRAEAQKLIYEAENMLTDESRQALFRRKMLEHVEGIISASVKPMEKIGDIRIMQLGGMGEGGLGNGGKNMTDEVIDSALRYRVQAPMIDQLLQEIGIEGGSLAKMGGLIREARDLDSISKSAEAKKTDGDAK